MRDLLLLAAAASTAQDNRDSDRQRYEVRDPLSFTMPRKPVTRKDYVDFVRPLAASFYPDEPSV